VKSIYSTHFAWPAGSRIVVVVSRLFPTLEKPFHFLLPKQCHLGSMEDAAKI